MIYKDYEMENTMKFFNKKTPSAIVESVTTPVEVLFNIVCERVRDKGFYEHLFKGGKKIKKPREGLIEWSDPDSRNNLSFKFEMWNGDCDSVTIIICKGKTLYVESKYRSKFAHEINKIIVHFNKIEHEKVETKRLEKELQTEMTAVEMIESFME